MIGLSRPYLQISDGKGLSYGGSQMRSEKELIRRCGCGPVAALDLCAYLEGRDRSPIPLEDYNRELDRLCRRFFFLIPYVGINGISLIAGLNLMFLEKHLPYRAFWAASGGRLWERCEQMLRKNIPVILSIGPNFPAFWGKNRLNFYVRMADGRYLPSTPTKAHYVTVTGMDENWVRISSWGRQYYISRKEYESYTKAHSNYLVSNLVVVKPLQKADRP